MGYAQGSYGVSSSTATTTTPVDQRSWLQERFGMTAAQLPFSFEYLDTSAATWPLSETSRSLSNNRVLYTMVWNDPETELTLTVEATEYIDTRAVEWVLWFENTGTTKLAPLSGVLPLNASLAPFAVNLQSLYYARGASDSMTDFATHQVALNTSLTLNTRAGRSSDPTLPFFNLYGPQGGAIVAIGWSGDWKARFNPESNDPTRLAIGMPEMRRRPPRIE